MRNRGRRRNAGRRLVAVGAGGSVALTGNDILTITDDGSGNLLVTTAAPHGLAGSEAVAIEGTSHGPYNVEWTVDGVPTATTWFAGGSYGGADSTGGTWSLV